MRERCTGRGGVEGEKLKVFYALYDYTSVLV